MNQQITQGQISACDHVELKVIAKHVEPLSELLALQ